MNNFISIGLPHSWIKRNRPKLSGPALGGFSDYRPGFDLSLDRWPISRQSQMVGVSHPNLSDSHSFLFRLFRFHLLPAIGACQMCNGLRPCVQVTRRAAKLRLACCFPASESSGSSSPRNRHKAPVCSSRETAWLLAQTAVVTLDRMADLVADPFALLPSDRLRLQANLNHDLDPFFVVVTSSSAASPILVGLPVVVLP